MTSCAEDHTDSESVSGSKKKKRFLGFRRRSTNDLSQSRARVKKPAWFDSQRCQSDDEGMQITKVYHIDEPRDMREKKFTKSEDIMVGVNRIKVTEIVKDCKQFLEQIFSDVLK